MTGLGGMAGAGGGSWGLSQGEGGEEESRYNEMNEEDRSLQPKVRFLVKQLLR